MALISVEMGRISVEMGLIGVKMGSKCLVSSGKGTHGPMAPRSARSGRPTPEADSGSSSLSREPAKKRTVNGVEMVLKWC